MEVRDVRRRAAAGASAKFPPPWADRLLGTKDLLAQASSLGLAIYVANQLSHLAEGGEVADLCCGLGADSIGLAMAGHRVIGYDASRQAILCAAHNARVAGVADRCRFEAADVTQLSLSGEIAVHIDPARRAGGGRSISPARYSPGAKFLRQLPTVTRTGALKMSPAVDYHTLADWPHTQLEYISTGGVCRQLVLWWTQTPPADTAQPSRKATVVFGEMTSPESISLPAGEASAAPLGEVGRWLIEPDPAVIAAGATDDLSAFLARSGACRPWRIDPQLDWLFADNSPGQTPLARSYRILEVVAGRPGDVRRAVRALGGGVVAVKPRGVRLDTDRLQRQLRGPGKRCLTVLWGRVGLSQRAIIAEGEGPSAQ